MRRFSGLCALGALVGVAMAAEPAAAYTPALAKSSPVPAASSSAAPVYPVAAPSSSEAAVHRPAQVVNTVVTGPSKSDIAAMFNADTCPCGPCTIITTVSSLTTAFIYVTDTVTQTVTQAIPTTITETVPTTITATSTVEWGASTVTVTVTNTTTVEEPTTVTKSRIVTKSTTVTLPITVGNATTVTEPTTITRSRIVTKSTTVTKPTTVFTTEIDTELTTEYVTRTSTTTFETSYPVTVTTLTLCGNGHVLTSTGTDGSVIVVTRTRTRTTTLPYPPGSTVTVTPSTRTVLTTSTIDLTTTVPPPGYSPAGYALLAEEAGNNRDDYCETITKTRYSTTTATKEITIIETSVTTEVDTVTGPGKTIIEPTTVIQPTTVIEPTTIIQPGTTVVLPGTTIVQPGTTIIQPGTTVTQPARTITAPGQPTTVTLPGTTEILPGTTVVSRITEQLPGQTVTVTKDGVVVTTVLPGVTAIRTTTLVLGPQTTTIPAGTVTVTPIFEVTNCPVPTVSSAPLAVDSDLTFGCRPGYVCNPPKPKGCNFFDGPPADSFLCRPQDCIVAPPFTNVTWKPCDTEYYPPSYGYFNLNPEAFGLSYGIFEFSVYDKVVDGHVSTVTTGDWTSQVTLSEYPRPTTTVNKNDKRATVHRLSKRDINTTPAVCFEECNNAYIVASLTGKSDSLCQPPSAFLDNYKLCRDCIKENSDQTKDVGRTYVAPQFAQYLDWCNVKSPSPAASALSQPEAAIGSQPVQTTSQQNTGSLSFTPISLSSTSFRNTTSAAKTTSGPQTTSAIQTSAPLTTTEQTSTAATTESTVKPTASKGGASRATSNAFFMALVSLLAVFFG